MNRWAWSVAGVVGTLLLAGCGGPEPYVYHYLPGRTATLENGYASTLEQAPERVHQAISGGNQIAGLPYRFAGGHAQEMDTGYDCSGAASYVLRSAGLLAGSMPSSGFRHYGESGPGRWISVYARRDHTFLVVAGLRFDTSYHNGKGPAWSTRSRPASGSVVRHPAGF